MLQADSTQSELQRPASRWLLGIVLVVFVGLAQLSGLSLIGYSAWRELMEPYSPVVRFPLVPYALLFGDEIIVPVCGMTVAGRTVRSTDVIALRGINPETGQTRDVSLPEESSPGAMFADRHFLWCFGKTKAFRFDGANWETISLQGGTGTPVSWPFSYNGLPAQISLTNQGQFWLMTLDDGSWRHQARIAVPGAARVWINDESTGRQLLAPRTSPESAGTGGPTVRLSVVPFQNQYLLLQRNLGSPVAYRLGFDLVATSDTDHPASGLAPENSAADTTGWIQADGDIATDFGVTAGILGNAVVLADNHHLFGLDPRRGGTALWSLEQVQNSEGLLTLASTSDGQRLYLVTSTMLGDVKITAVEASGLRPLPIRIEGFGRPLQRWVGRILLQCLAVLILGVVITVVLGGWLSGSTTFAFGDQSHELGTLLRRSMARAIDMTLVLAFPAAYSLEQLRRAAAALFSGVWDDQYLDSSVWWPALLWLAIGWTFLVLSIAVWSATPGQRLFGLRVVRTTLRRCGLARALMRELLFWFDAPFLVTVIPGVLCYLMTGTRQRLGDLASGTLVIDVRRDGGFITSVDERSVPQTDFSVDVPLVENVP